MEDFKTFLQLGNNQMLTSATKISSSTTISTKDDSVRDNGKKERVRREKMTDMFFELQSLIPSLDRFEKRTREIIVEDAIEYIKYLEEEKKTLEDLKKMKEMGGRSKPLLLECSSRSASSVNVSVSNGVAFFGIELASKRGLLTSLFRVFERNQAEVLAANIGTNNQQFLRVTVTVLMQNIGGGSVEKIKRELMTL